MIAHPSDLQGASQCSTRWPASGARCHSEEPRSLRFRLDGRLVMGGATEACLGAALVPQLLSGMPPYSRMLALTFADPSVPCDARFQVVSEADRFRFRPDAVAAGRSRLALWRIGVREGLASCSRGFPRGYPTGKIAGLPLARVTLLLFR